MDKPRTELPEVVLERLRAVMLDRGLGPCELSEKAGLAEGHVGLILTRKVKSPAATTLAAIATALGVSLDSLLYGDGDTGVRSRLPVPASEPPAATEEPVAKAG